MKRVFSFCVLVLCLALIFSCASSPAQPVPEQSGSSVWTISKNGNTLFLGGSIHLLRDQDFPLPLEFDAALSQSEVLVLETDTDLMATEEVSQYLISRVMLSDGQTLQTFLDQETYEMLAAKAGEYGLPIEAVSNFKPSMVMMMLSMLQIEEMGLTQLGVDFYYLEKARDENKQVYFLELIETQINMIATMGEGYENEFIRYSLQDMESTEHLLFELLDDWRRGNPRSTETMLISMKEEWPSVYKSLITERHDAWVPQIVDFLNSDSTFFVVVGLAHIHGPDGLLQLLENLGYTTEQFIEKNYK